MVAVRHVILPGEAVLAFRPIAILLLALYFCGLSLAQLTPQQKSANLESFEVVWRTVRDRHPDPKLNGLNWQAIHDTTRPAIENAQSMPEVRRVLTGMLARLNASHYAIIPADRYKETPAATTGPEASPQPAPAPVARAIDPAPAALPDTEPARTPPEGTAVRFGNLPETRLYFQSRALPDGAGYIHFNEFLDPASIMPQFEAALKSFHNAPGIILDLRGNPGGIGIMAMGIAGFFIDKPGLKLGDMTMRDATLKFVIFPRPETYQGPLAILIDEGSASTSEILAGGLQDLKRARIFGVKSAGAALPSDIIRLPNGDGFQYAQASYTSISGKILEGNGVTPDVIVEQTGARDLVLEAADDWIREAKR
jgi:C-terminal processing protease CtpA/Prc